MPAQTIALRGLDSRWSADLTIRAGAEDQVEFSGTTELGGKSLVVEAGTIELAGTIATRDASVELHAADRITLAAGSAIDNVHGSVVAEANAVTQDGRITAEGGQVRLDARGGHAVGRGHDRRVRCDAGPRRRERPTAGPAGGIVRPGPRGRVRRRRRRQRADRRRLPGRQPGDPQRPADLRGLGRADHRRCARGRRWRTRHRVGRPDDGLRGCLDRPRRPARRGRRTGGGFRKGDPGLLRECGSGRRDPTAAAAARSCWTPAT